VVPLWIVPLFYRLTPLRDPALRARLLALAARVGVMAAEVAVADFSRKGRTANAAVVGLGRTRRILVSDTLLASFPPDEVEVVLAHELAHHARGHLAKALALQAVLLVVVFALADALLRRVAAPLGVVSPADPAGLPLLALVLSGLGLLVTPGAAAWSRRLEREADAEALAVTGAPGPSWPRWSGSAAGPRRAPSRQLRVAVATHPALRDRPARAMERRLAGAAPSASPRATLQSVSSKRRAGAGPPPAPTTASPPGSSGAPASNRLHDRLRHLGRPARPPRPRPRQPTW
jgi:STE24 endopeptidase